MEAIFDNDGTIRCTTTLDYLGSWFIQDGVRYVMMKVGLDHKKITFYEIKN